MVELTPVETKLLRLALDINARGGEISTSATKFVESLRRRGVSATEFEEAFGLESGLAFNQLKPDYGLCLMPFGKRKGERFIDISPFELRSARRWAMSTPELARKFAEFIHDVDEFLKQ